MIASVSCRQLSPRLASAFLVLVLLAAPPLASAATMVQAISVATDRVDYVNVPGFNDVTATATVAFNGNGALDPVKFEWFDPGAPFPFRTVSIPTIPSGPQAAQASDTWTATREGIGFTIRATINVSVGGGPQAASPPATFNVYNRSSFVVVSDIAVTTSPVHENGTVATAVADLTYAGNASQLLGVRFDWYYPDRSLAHRSVDPAPTPVSNRSARATGAWSIDRVGSAFRVNATYLGTPAITNATAFDVLERRVKTQLPGDITAGRMILDLISSPWGVCFNASIARGAELFIEAGAEIRVCPGAGLFVNGTLTVDALPTKKVYFLSYVPVGAPMRAGDWRGGPLFSPPPRTPTPPSRIPRGGRPR